MSLVLEYNGPTPQPLFVMGRPDGIATILRDVIRPRAAYAAMRPDVLGAVEGSYRVDPGPEMVRMWVDRAHFRPYPATVQRLLPVDIGDLNRLYQLGFASWLPTGAIAEGVYYGVRVNGMLVSAAGTHVISPSARLAVIGNVLTHIDYRGRGFATAVTGAVTAELLRSCDQVVLNVRADNPPALNAYRRLGYRRAHPLRGTPHPSPGLALARPRGAAAPPLRPQGDRRLMTATTRPRPTTSRTSASPPRASDGSNGPSGRCPSCA